MARILVVDDEKKMTRVLKLLLDGEGHTTDTSGSAEDAVRLLDQYIYDIVVTDLKMPGKSGIDLLRDVKEKRPETEVVMMTAYATTRSAVEAMKSGAYDYIIKPFENDELLLLVKRILEKQSLTSEKTALAEENRELKKQIRGGLDKTGLIGRGERMQEVYRLVEKVAPTTTTVLIRGESGTGKELIARAIHYNSPRKDKPLITVNCPSIPETLMESEIFGHVKGAFTGALKDRKGKFELADKSTIFFDEIGDLKEDLQARLLRVLQEKEFEKVGDSKPIKVDARVVAATNKNLEELVQVGKFREDLFYRLNVVTILIPPLRERKDDIPFLVDFFVEKHSKKQPFQIADGELHTLTNHKWPGNVRELENTIERAIVISRDGIITPELLSPVIRQFKTSFTQQKEIIKEENLTLNEIERIAIIKALEKTNGNQTNAAKLLGIKRHVLIYRMKKLEIE